jgi:hypothetical protein
MDENAFLHQCRTEAALAWEYPEDLCEQIIEEMIVLAREGLVPPCQEDPTLPNSYDIRILAYACRLKSWKEGGTDE